MFNGAGKQRLADCHITTVETVAAYSLKLAASLFFYMCIYRFCIVFIALMHHQASKSNHSHHTAAKASSADKSQRTQSTSKTSKTAHSTKRQPSVDEENHFVGVLIGYYYNLHRNGDKSSTKMATKGDPDAEDTSGNFLRQFRDKGSRQLKKFSATQFMEVWNHYDSDGEYLFTFLGGGLQY